jgi:glycosyltransferase involved in cell wall biosynthesis
MKVAVIAAEMEGRATGVGRYLEGLLHGTNLWHDGVEWHLFFQGDPPAPPWLEAGDFHAHFSRHNGSRVWWEQVLVSRSLAGIEVDVIFGPANTLPFASRAPSVVTVHDLSFEVLPQEFDLRERWRRRVLARRAVRLANRVLAVSQHMAALLTKHYGLPEERIAVVPHGVDRERFSPIPEPADGEVLDAMKVGRPYVLWAGTVFERRLPREVLEAFAAVRDSHPQLGFVIAGANRMRRPERLEAWIKDLGLEGAVRNLGWVEENVLAPLYRGAELGVYVSRHEGFGVPPLECAACGTPVVVSHGLGLDDVWPDYPFRVQDFDVESIREAMTRALEDQDLRSRVKKKAGPILTALDWEQSSRRLVAELGRALVS